MNDLQLPSAERVVAYLASQRPSTSDEDLVMALHVVREVYAAINALTTRRVVQEDNDQRTTQ